jgi:hypothetical protein
VTKVRKRRAVLSMAEREKRQLRNRRDWRRHRGRVEALADLRSGGRCQDCDGPGQHWHHLDPAAKSFTLGTGHGVGTRTSMARLIAETAKCLLVCASCHVRRHARMRELGLTVDNRPPGPWTA